MVIFFCSVLVALTISFFCSLVEATLLSLTPAQVSAMAQRHPRQSEAWRRFKTNIERPIAVILIFNTAAHTIGASIAGAKFSELFGDQRIWLFGLLFTYVMLQFTEILPKTLGVRLNSRLAPALAAPLAFGIRLMMPVIHVIHWINRPFEVGRAAPTSGTSVDDLIALAALARHAEELTPHQEQIINRTARLEATTASQVMVPLDQVAMLPDNVSTEDAIAKAAVDAHTRYPVCSAADPGHLVGYVNVKDLTALTHAGDSTAGLASIIRPVHMVSPNESVSQLLQLFVDQHAHMAIVQIDHRAIGMVTFEDVLEEVIGPRSDELTLLPRHVHELADGLLLAGGGVSMRDLGLRLAWQQPPDEPLAQWVESEAASPLQTGDCLHHEGFRIQVRRLRRGRLYEAAISPEDSAVSYD